MASSTILVNKEMADALKELSYYHVRELNIIHCFFMLYDKSIISNADTANKADKDAYKVLQEMAIQMDKESFFNKKPNYGFDHEKVSLLYSLIKAKKNKLIDIVNKYDTGDITIDDEELCAIYGAIKEGKDF
jgi:hypothetical protein